MRCSGLGVAVDAPADGAVAETDVAQLVDGAGEGGVVLFGDVVFDRDADWAGEIGIGVVVGFREVDEGGSGALVGVRGEVGDGALENFETIDDGQGEEQASA